VPLLFIAIPLAVIVILNVFYTMIDHRAPMWAGMGVALFQLVLACFDVARCLTTGAAIRSDFFASFTVDLFSAVVLVIIGLISFITLIVAGATVHTSRFNFGSAVLLLIMGMNGVVMVTDVFSLYVFIEVTAASSFLLIAINKKRDELEGAFKYYMMSAIATIMMLISITLLFALTGDTSFAVISAYVAAHKGAYPVALLIAFVLYTVALCIKSGVVPFHTWVPDAHSSAPSPVSVMLAGVVIKVSGVYALMRIFRDVFLNNPALGSVLAILGLLSIAVGALGAIGQTDIKRMLAFSSVSQIGYIILGASTGSALGFVGAVMHFFNHATFKSLLFVDAAAILHQTGTRDMDQMGGLAQKMPVTGVSSVLGLLSMAGIPPLSGFWSKLVIVMAVWQVSPGMAIAALCLSALTLGYFLILQKKVFFGKVAPNMQNVNECGISMQFVQVLLSAINVLAGILFPLLFVFFQGKGLI
jgi:proton-translocating NADH-quinone oxidoreductase chain N